MYICYLYLQLLLGFANTCHRERQSYSVRLYEKTKVCNPIFHRPIEQVSSICTIKSFSLLDQLFNIKLNLKHRVWKKFVKKEQRSQSMDGGIER